MPTDLYRVLGLRRNASQPAVRKAYRKLARQHHPDHNPGDEQAAARFRNVQIAYEVLSDSERRARYDATGEWEERPVADNGLKDIGMLLARVLEGVLDGLGKQGRRLDQTDFAGELRNSLADGRQQMKQQRAAAERRKRDLQEVIERLTVTEGENVVAAAARQQLAACDDRLAMIAREEELIGKCLEHLKVYGYKHDAVQSGLRYFTTSTVL